MTIEWAENEYVHKPVIPKDGVCCYYISRANWDKGTVVAQRVYESRRGYHDCAWEDVPSEIRGHLWHDVQVCIFNDFTVEQFHDAIRGRYAVNSELNKPFDDLPPHRTFFINAYFSAIKKEMEKYDEELKGLEGKNGSDSTASNH